MGSDTIEINLVFFLLSQTLPKPKLKPELAIFSDNPTTRHHYS